VLPYLPLTRQVLAFGAGFFALCGLTHAGMTFGNHHVPVTWFWAIEHLAQAIATWGFIITFHVLLRRAARRNVVADAAPPAPAAAGTSSSTPDRGADADAGVTVVTDGAPAGTGDAGGGAGGGDGGPP
jgi:hypothetical protein